ncbi:MAG TPA: ATP-dependent DNA ligase [Bacilli bacterium]|nr:ATP-dependent DNA ligase [Bacilli bacterium]
MEVDITHPDKIIWEEPYINKAAFLSYLLKVSTFILPFLENRALTVKRYPHGAMGDFFYQKSCPDYAPSFVKTKQIDDHDYIICDNVPTLLWLGNQLALEFHIPFQTIESEKPFEIVFDLDPPSRDGFHLAIKAAKELKGIFDNFGIVSYPKLSGGTGLQIHIPLPRNSLTYDETRVFTSFIANYLVEKFPDDFTIERFKKNRGSRLYIDYVQHAEGKTIICPYSGRGREGATVAAPLDWQEVNRKLRIEKYNIPYVLERLAKEACPMRSFFEQENDSLLQVVSMLKEKMEEKAL